MTSSMEEPESKKALSTEAPNKDSVAVEDTPDNTSRPISRQSRGSSASRSRSLTDGPSDPSKTTPRNSRIIPDAPDKVDEEPHVSPTEETAKPADNQDTPKLTQLTSNHHSSSTLDDVSLGGDGARESPTDEKHEKSSAPSTPHQDDTLSKPPSRGEGIASRLPSMPWGVGSGVKSPESKPVTAQGARKLGMGFSSWLSRKGSASIDAATVAATQQSTTESRRNTMTSINSLSSNPELTLTKLEEEEDSDSSKAIQQPRSNLRDRFKYLRMREEAGIQTDEGKDATPSSSGGALAGLIGRSASLGVGIGSPAAVAEEKEGEQPASSEAVESPPAASPGAMPAGPDPSLAPGTAAGMAAGPSAMTDPAAPVDWDLWQSVVYEGPSAVAKTSSEELARAIAGGIPSAIRGVVWQVLAQSKNEDLEAVYRELVHRGTDKDKDMALILQGHAPSHSLANGNLKEKPNGASSASSIHSDHSTPSAAAVNGTASTSTPQEKDAEAIMKLQSTVMAERQKKAREDRASIQKLERVIRRDLGARTSYSKYAAAAGLQDGLFGVCKAYALFDEGVGYAQGMNFLVMPLLFNMPEEEAFCLLVRLMNQYHLREMFIQDMPGLHLHLYQFERLLEDFEPALYCHLHRRNVRPQLYATQWFLTLFAYRFPLQLVLRIYDLILSEGLEGAILKFGIVLMQKNAEALLGMNDMASLTTFLKERLFDIYIDQAPSNNSILESGFFGSSGDKEVYRADVLVQDACAVKVTPEMLKTYTAEWEEKAAAEKEREAEIESFRTTNATLSSKIRSLEQRTEKSDTEHVQMASELVRTKVDNQELTDKVESLRGQTEELKAMVDKQTEEVEARLKDEMERIMQRNSEVQNTNRGLEEQMAEMEKELVETKMRFAEMNSEHESLRQKWSDLRRALDA